MTVERVVAGVVASLALAVTFVACARDWSWGWTEPWGWAVIVPLLVCQAWLLWRARNVPGGSRV